MCSEQVNDNSVQFDTAMLTDKGMVRENNEDNCFALETSQLTDSTITYYGLYLVADGMGGHQAGEVASAKAVDIISSAMLGSIQSSYKKLNISQLIVQAIEKANSEIYNIARSNPAFSGMGTTVTLGLRVNNQLYLGHVGDSRAYLIRGNSIAQLTNDHSLVASLIQSGMITKEEAKNHPERNKIFRCVGNSQNVSIDTYIETGRKESLIIQKGDSFVFCTDGLSNYVSDNEILAAIEQPKDSYQICQQFISLAKQRGGDDNITVIVVKSKNPKDQDTVKMSLENVRSTIRM